MVVAIGFLYGVWVVLAIGTVYVMAKAMQEGD